MQIAGSSTFFSDPSVVAKLLNQGLVVEQTSLGSRQVCEEPSLVRRFDVANSGSQDAAVCVLQKLAKEGVDARKFQPFSSPMVIMTYKPIVALLKKIHVVTQFNGITIFNVRAYLKVVSSGKRWTDIPGNTAFPNRGRILVSTTNPKLSNSGGMFAAIAYAAQNNGDPVRNLRPRDPRLAVIRRCFAELGNLNSHTPDLLQQFLIEGMDGDPMALVYESDYIFTRLSGQAGPGSALTAMYPDPDVISDNTLVSWTPAGNRLTSLLTSPAMGPSRNGTAIALAATPLGSLVIWPPRALPCRASTVTTACSSRNCPHRSASTI